MRAQSPHVVFKVVIVTLEHNTRPLSSVTTRYLPVAVAVVATRCTGSGQAGPSSATLAAALSPARARSRSPAPLCRIQPLYLAGRRGDGRPCAARDPAEPPGRRVPPISPKQPRTSPHSLGNRASLAGCTESDRSRRQHSSRPASTVSATHRTHRQGCGILDRQRRALGPSPAPGFPSFPVRPPPEPGSVPGAQLRQPHHASHRKVAARWGLCAARLRAARRPPPGRTQPHGEIPRARESRSSRGCPTLWEGEVLKVLREGVGSPVPGPQLGGGQLGGGAHRGVAGHGPERSRSGGGAQSLATTTRVQIPVTPKSGQPLLSRDNLAHLGDGSATHSTRWHAGRDRAIRVDLQPDDHADGVAL